MHCLPVRRERRVADEILDGPNSLVTHEASNRVGGIQAVLSTTVFPGINKPYGQPVCNQDRR